MKRLLYLLIVWLTALWGHQAMAQSENTWTKAQYDALGKIVKWTDAEGNEHANYLTDEATETSHIIALLKTAYTNSSVPGILYGGYTSAGKREGEITYGNITGWNINSVTKPTTEGYTTFMVKVKDGWSKDNDRKCSTESDIKNYIESSIESVQLLTASMTVSGSNPGTLYKLSGEANRFFFMSKGRARIFEGSRADRTPFWGMYEEYSPVDESAKEGLTDFYSKMKEGNVYSVVHDCGSVLGTGHYFAMTGQNGTENRDITGLTFFLTDYRLKYWNGRDENRKNKYIEYNQNYAPSVCLYSVMLEANAKASTADKQYTVDLDWTTTLAKVIGNSSTKEEYHLYVVNSDGTLDEIKLDDNSVAKHSYDVPQKTHGYSITYVVSAKPVDNAAGFDPVWSNYATVDIPGLDPKELLVLGIGGTAYSNYDQDNEINQYRNMVMMNNSVGTFIASDSMAVGSKFTFYRMGKLTGKAETVDVVAAVVTITSKTGSGFAYKVEYKNQAGVDQSKYPATTGTFSVKDNGAVDFNNFTICDQFNASTAENAQPEKYTYQVKYAPDGNKDEFYSNEYEVKVYKTASEMTNTVTKQEVSNDTDHSLKVTSVPQIKFAVENNQAIKQYTVWRSGNNIGRAQGRPDGSYGTFELFTDGEKLTGESKDGQATINDNTYDFKEAGQYVPVINVTADNGDINTYGCDIKNGYMPKVTVVESGKEMSNYELRDSITGKALGARYFKTTVTVQAYVPEGLTIMGYRLWRDCGSKAVEETQQYEVRKDPLTPWFNGLIQQGRSAQSKHIYGIEEGAMDGDYMKISDMFGAIKPTETSPLYVDYLVRLYCEDDDGNCYVAEATLPVTYTSSTPTGIDDVSGDKDNGFSVMPSVATSQITVNGCNGAIVVRSITGAEMLRIQANGEISRTVDVGSLAPGYYIVTSGGRSQRIIKN